MNVFITGGAGFIGSHLVERFLQEGYNVSILDDLSTGSLENIAPFLEWPKFSYTVDSVFNELRVNELVEGADLVLHLAATVGVQLAVDNPIRTMETNARGTEIVLQAAAKKATRVVVASSSEVYGKSTAIPFREDADLVMGPSTVGRWGYGCSKMFDEFLALGYAAERQLPVTIVRFFNTAGPRQSSRYGMVLPQFVGQALLGKPLTIFGTGQQRRCFGYVGDVVEALVRIVKTPKTVGEVINIGNDQEISIEELANLVKKITYSNSDTVHIPYEQAYGKGFEDVVRRVPDLGKLQHLIGYRPTTPIETIIRFIAADLDVRFGGPLAA